MIRRALRVQLRKVDPQGEVSVAGSTRTGRETARSGRIKQIDYKTIVQSLVFGAAVTGEPAFRSAAERIAARRGWLDPGSPR
jgi:hypothetical protein